MKRMLAFSLALVLSVSAGAQVFNHLSVGLGVGTDGASLELASPLGRHVELRAGYGLAPGLVGFTFKEVAVPEHPGNPSGSCANVPLNVKLGMSDARLLFNLYPSGKGGFHFTVGVYMGSQRVVRAAATGLPADYNTAGIEVDDYLVKASGGVLEAYLCAPGLGSPAFAVKPYAGIGFGRAVDPGKRVSFVFDLGAQYQGAPTIWAPGESLTGRVQDVQISADSLGDVTSVVDGYGKYLAFWPTLNFHLYVKLF